MAKIQLGIVPAQQMVTWGPFVFLYFCWRNLLE